MILFYPGRIVDCVDSITRIKIDVGRETACQESDIHRSSNIYRIVKHFELFPVSVTVKLSSHSRFESIVFSWGCQ